MGRWDGRAASGGLKAAVLLTDTRDRGRLKARQREMKYSALKQAPGGSVSEARDPKWEESSAKRRRDTM